jgi:ubiquinone/menaquinone biosynthesis C-methylase UbiE
MKSLKIIENSVLKLLFLLISSVVSGQNDISEPWEKRLNERQPPEKVMPVIGIKPGMIIGEIGAGRGRYTVYLARETGPAGKILANDIDEASLSYLKGRCRRLGINNVETIVGEMNDPLFPDNSLDMAIMVLVYHMIEQPDKLLMNLKKDLKSGAQLVILDPRDKFIDEEFGIDRSKQGVNKPTIMERVERSAMEAGYDLVKVETFLPDDYIFILKPKALVQKEHAGELLKETIIKNGIDASLAEFNRMKKDTTQFELPERIFTNLGYEFIGSRSYPEAIAVINMGIELFPKSSKLHGELGEVYILTEEKEKARACYKLYLENNPDIPNGNELLQNFDIIYEEMRPKKN